MLVALVASMCLVLPAHTGVIDPFRAPDCERCAGNRGLELATRSGDTVQSGIDGHVSFAGLVGGRLYVVVRAANDPRVRVTYGGLASRRVNIGDTVMTGEPLGVAESSLFVGLRIGDRHVDPTRYVAADRDVSAGAPADRRPGASTPGRPRFRITLGTVPPRTLADRPAGRC